MPYPNLKECQECGAEVLRRVRCAECGKLLCSYCFHHSFHTVKQREEVER